MSNRIPLKNWADYLKLAEPYTNKKEILAKSALSHTSPEKNRPEVWLSLVDPDFFLNCQNTYKEIKLQKKVSIPSSTLIKIKLDASKVSGFHLSCIITSDKTEKIINNLAIFISKRPDIGYNYGMIYIIGLLLYIFPEESDAFIVFCFIIEKIFPENFFLKDNRELGLHTELRAVSLMAELLRPKLVDTLKAVFKPAGSNTKEKDLSPFILFTKRTSEAWFKTLFVPFLFLEDACRVWDTLLIYGFDFLSKFCLALFSKHEKDIKNSIKLETKSIGLGISVDALIISGNLSRLKILRKIKRLPIEKTLKKALMKKTYIALQRNEFINKAAALEKENFERLVRLRQSKRLLRSKDLSVDVCKRLFETINSISSLEEISRGLFVSVVTKELGWSLDLSSNFYTTFDQEGSDTVPISVIKTGLCVLANVSIEEKIKLCFAAFGTSEPSGLGIDSICEVLISLENALDFRSNIVKSNLEKLKDYMSLNYSNTLNSDDFLGLVAADPICEVFLKIINSVESSDPVSSIEMSLANISTEGRYSDTHSPLMNSIISSPDSYTSDEQPGLEFSNKNTQPELPVVELQVLQSDCEDLEIETQINRNSFLFIFRIGNIRQKPVDSENLKENTFNSNQGFENIKLADIPQNTLVDKQRNNCSRLCSTEKCGIV